MNLIQQHRWQQIRQQGAPLFILKYAIGIYGGLLFITLSIVFYFLRPQHFNGTVLMMIGGTCVTMGLLMGILGWLRQENAHNRVLSTFKGQS